MCIQTLRHKLTPFYNLGLTSARYVLAVILAPSQSFPCRLQYQRELVKEVNIGIEREEPVQRLAEEIHIAFACKIIHVSRKINNHFKVGA